MELLFDLFAGEELSHFGGMMEQIGEDQLRELTNGHEGNLELLS
jgi:hypothetical protein